MGGLLLLPLLAALTAVPVPRTLTVTADTRLLVIAPHPDDEILGAGGLMRRVHDLGGFVHVVYLTDGDGYPEGVRLEERGTKKNPSSSDFRDYGRRRQHEAQDALKTLGLDEHDTTFLRFPDGGLCKLTHTYWSDRHRAYRSPYTRRDRPPESDTIVPNAEYRGEDLTLELARIIAEFGPTLILVPRKEDQHPDHCAAWYFLADALGGVARVLPGLAPDVVNYIVHYDDWPFNDERATLSPPPGLRGGASGWMRVTLTPEELRAKREAIRRYGTQMHAMRSFLEAFARSNEVFSRPAPARVVLPTKSSPCCDQ
jgi:LmbE family N-acetylglucosaminyl deacetylase